MFQNNKLAQLYPHLNLSRTMPQRPKVQEPPKEEVRPEPVAKRSISIERPKRQQTPQPPVKRDKTPEPPKEPVTPKQVKIDEPPKEEVKIIESPKEEKVRQVVPRPNRVRPAPKPEPKRENQVPKKGERGLQRKYTLEQRKQMYLDRLSRKSVANADKELSKVTEVLEKAEYDDDKLALMEKAVKGQLKLINFAKYFAGRDTNESNDNSIVSEANYGNSTSREEENRDDVLSEQSEESIVSEH